MATFNISSGIKDIQNKLVASSIKQTSNMELLRSEEAINALIKSYTERFRSTEGALTDASKYVAESKTVIKVEEFNKLFESLYIDLSSLYSELGMVDRIMSLNLARNKNYFSVIKKRLRELWKRLRLTRLNIYDLNPADESYFESFNSSINIAKATNIEIDGKQGFITLEPSYLRTHNKPYEIKNIVTKVYPVDNDEGGVQITTNDLNTFSGNYAANGPRDMLENGLWKEEVICSEVPDMVVNIGDSATPEYKAYKGVVAIVDIEYAYPVEINRLDIDIFGEKALRVDGVRYKSDSDDSWKSAESEVQGYQDKNYTDLEELNKTRYEHIKGSEFDIISFTNIRPILVKELKLIFNQENYSFISSVDTQSISAQEQINKDLSERRYELIKFGVNLDEELTRPVNEENRSLYHKLMSAVESTRNIDDILNKIGDIINPELKITTVDFGAAAKFELGTWSIEPKEEIYTSSKGKFETKPFTITDRHLIGATLTAKQHAPGASSINWYVNIRGKDIPLVESSKTLRKEPLYQINMAKYSLFSDWPGSFCLLDLPMDPYTANTVSIYEDGILCENISSSIVFLNSRLLYFPTISNFSAGNYCIRYPIALYNCCNMYVLQAKTGVTANNDIIAGVCSSRRDILQQFIKTATYEVGGATPFLTETFTVTNALYTIEEAESLLGESFSSCIFIDDAIISQLSNYTGTIFDDIMTTSSTKYSTTLTDVETYMSGGGVFSADLSVLGTEPNMVPFSLQRPI